MSLLVRVLWDELEGLCWDMPDIVFVIESMDFDYFGSVFQLEFIRYVVPIRIEFVILAGFVNSRAVIDRIENETIDVEYQFMVGFLLWEHSLFFNEFCYTLLLFRK